MDDRRFDQIARLFAGGRSRRQAIKAVLGGVLATGGLRTRRQVAAAELGCCRCQGATDCQTVQTKADCQAICGPKRREAIYDPYAQCENGACQPADEGDFGCCLCLGDRRKVCNNVKDLAACKTYCKKNAEDEPGDADVDFNPKKSCQPGSQKGVYACRVKTQSLASSACRIVDFGLPTSAALPLAIDEGLAHAGGTVYVSEAAYARTGQTAATVAPLIFGDAGALQVRVDLFFAADGTHNVYLYQIATASARRALTLAGALAEQMPLPDAEDVSKEIPGWEENIASRGSFPTDQGNLSRIQSFNAVDDDVVWIVDDQYGDRKNTVTLHRNMLEEISKVRKWFNPDTSAEGSQATPPGLDLLGLMPIVEGVEQFSWVQTARDGVIVPRYNVDSAETAQVLGGAINAFNGAYVVERNGVSSNVYASFREFASPEEAAEYVASYDRHFTESDERIGLQRSRDEAFQVCLTTSGLRANWRSTMTEATDCSDLTVPERIALTTALGYVLAWHPAENVRLIGWSMVVSVHVLAMELAWFVLYGGDAVTFDAAELASLEGYGEARNSVLDLSTFEPTAWARYQSPPTGACFPEVPV